MKVQTGIDVLNSIQDGFKEFKGLRVGLLVHSASIDSKLRYTQDLFISNKIIVKSLFAPEHGLFGTQEYMEKVQNSKLKISSKKSLPVYSLYGKTLKPPKEMLKEIDIMVIDLQDIGTRYYTYIWTMALALQACAQYKKKVVVLDRPNPINGIAVEGPVLDTDFSSFVGLYPIPVRHGMTIGELALMFNSEFKIGAELKIIKMRNWQRKMWFDETGLEWVLPSPNMPTLATATVYPGMCLLEGTNVSEGRGTTKPFELFGAPWIDPQKLCEKLNNVGVIHELPLPGVIFRPAQFIPYTSKFKHKLCKGAQLHITNRDEFMPFLTGVWVIKVIHDMYPELFKWSNPPYEYEKKKLPFDLLAGNSWIRKYIEQNIALKEIQHKWEEKLESFNSIREKYLLY